ncbi:hypothetical protein KFE25_000302 [Diacronema lutheri]|uniref:Uncharacterized protein n=1 Tax=Diacronema lutheri TaxID=2081491 RepID=A0A8J5XP54_DIALT|nr:hypothetical protein KFE25_000302 [Diacronema lutheri]
MGGGLVEVAFTLGAPQRVDELGANRRSSRLTQELYFSPPARLRAITFQNYYSAAVAVHVRGRALPPATDLSGASASTWHVALETTQLMDDPHFEDDAQRFHSFDLTSPQLAPVDVLDSAHALRLTYFQPSPAWADFGARRLACFTREDSAAAGALAADVHAVYSPHGSAVDALRPAWRSEHGALLAQMGNVLAAAARAAELVDELAAQSAQPGAEGQGAGCGAPLAAPPPGEWRGAPVRALEAGTPYGPRHAAR